MGTKRIWSIVAIKNLEISLTTMTSGWPSGLTVNGAKGEKQQKSARMGGCRNSEEVEHPLLSKEKAEKHRPPDEEPPEHNTASGRREKQYVSELRERVSPTLTEPHRDTTVRIPTAASPQKPQLGPISVSVAPSSDPTSLLLQTPNSEPCPPTVFPHTLEVPHLPKMVDYTVPHITHTFSDLRHPNTAQAPASNLLHTITDHHHLPHLQYESQRHLSTDPISPQSAPLLPQTQKPPSPMPPLHVPGPGVTVGRMVMTASPPTVPPVPSFQQQRVTGFTVHCHHNPYHPPHLHVASSESHPSGPTQNPSALYLQDRKNDKDKNGEDTVGAFLRIGAPTGAAVSTKGYRRRGEDVGLVASLMGWWEKVINWFQG